MLNYLIIRGVNDGDQGLEDKLECGLVGDYGKGTIVEWVGRGFATCWISYNN